MSAARILIVEDDPAVLHMIRSVLDFGGFAHDSAERAQSALRKLRVRDFDLVLLDMALPDLHGSELIRSIRDVSSVPIIVVSGHSQEQDRIEALDLGADDFIPKPFMPGELLARIRAALRRHRRDALAPLRTPEIEIAPDRPVVLVRGEPVPLSRAEHALALALARRAGSAVGTVELCEAIWGECTARTKQGLYVLVNRLRRKVERDPAAPVHIVAEHGVGYRLVP